MTGGVEKRLGFATRCVRLGFLVRPFSARGPWSSHLNVLSLSLPSLKWGEYLPPPGRVGICQWMRALMGGDSEGLRPGASALGSAWRPPAPLPAPVRGALAPRPARPAPRGGTGAAPRPPTGSARGTRGDLQAEGLAVFTQKAAGGGWLCTDETLAGWDRRRGRPSPDRNL